MAAASKKRMAKKPAKAVKARRPARKPGRPTKLTRECEEKICAAIRAGNYGEVAAQAAGIGPSTFYRWMKEGREALRGREHDFYEAIKRAEAEGEAHAVVILRKAMSDGQWRAAKAFLELRHPERWRRKAEVEARIAPERERLDLSLLSEEELRALEEINERHSKPS